MRGRDDVVEGVVRVAKKTNIVPDDRLRLVGTLASYLFGGVGYALMAQVGGGIAAAEEKAVDDGGSALSQGGTVETVVEGGVGGKNR